jgi:hypothetical protein
MSERIETQMVFLLFAIISRRPPRAGWIETRVRPWFYVLLASPAARGRR